MVAQQSNPPGQPGGLSPEVELALEAAFRQLIEEHPGAEAAVERAVTAVGTEARQRGLPPEELLIAFKAIEERAADSQPGSAYRPHGLRSKMIRAMLEAYYR